MNIFVTLSLHMTRSKMTNQVDADDEMTGGSSRPVRGDREMGKAGVRKKGGLVKLGVT